MKPFIFPLQTIKNEKWQFISWVILLLSFGLLGFWIPLLDNLFLDEKNAKSFLKIVSDGSLSTFSLVILVEGLANFFNLGYKGKTKLTIGVKSIVYVVTILVFTINVYLYGKVNAGVESNLLKVLIIVFTSLSIFVAFYLYCFRKTDWEETADDYVKKQDEEIKTKSQQHSGNPLPE
jgi:hypothetical protein